MHQLCPRCPQATSRPSSCESDHRVSGISSRASLDFPRPAESSSKSFATLAPLVRKTLLKVLRATQDSLALANLDRPRKAESSSASIKAVQWACKPLVALGMAASPIKRSVVLSKPTEETKEVVQEFLVSTLALLASEASAIVARLDAKKSAGLCDLGAWKAMRGGRRSHAQGLIKNVARCNVLKKC